MHTYGSVPLMVVVAPLSGASGHWNSAIIPRMSIYEYKGLAQQKIN